MAASESPGATARRVLRQAGRGTLATALAAGSETWPYASLVLVAYDLDAAPLLFLSDLAEHTKNLKRDPRASLLCDATAGLADPLAGARVTVLGTLAPAADERLLDRYVARHPTAGSYRAFADFKLYRLTPRRAHLVAGFGRIHWIEADALQPAPAAAAALATAEPAILAHMNRDHADTVDLYAHRLLGLTGTGWRLTGVDPDGADLRREGTAARLAFAAPVGGADAVRREFVRLAAMAREARPGDAS
jgi:heme oxygenase (biliverdin-IX-beta and delta-forming)